MCCPVGWQIITALKLISDTRRRMAYSDCYLRMTYAGTVHIGICIRGKRRNGSQDPKRKTYISSSRALPSPPRGLHLFHTASSSAPRFPIEFDGKPFLFILLKLSLRVCVAVLAGKPVYLLLIKMGKLSSVSFRRPTSSVFAAQDRSSPMRRRAAGKHSTIGN